MKKTDTGPNNGDAESAGGHQKSGSQTPDPQTKDPQTIESGPGLSSDEALGIDLDASVSPAATNAASDSTLDQSLEDAAPWGHIEPTLIDYPDPTAVLSQLPPELTGDEAGQLPDMSFATGEQLPSAYNPHSAKPDWSSNNGARSNGSRDRAFDAARVPPHSIESEQALIGAMLLSDRAFEAAADLTVEVDFYQYNHRLIYRAIAALASESLATDVVTVTGWLEKHGFLEEAGGLHYVAALAQESPGASNAKAYAGIVRERSVLRQLISASNEIADAAFSPEGRDSKDLLDFAETKVFSIADQTNRAGDGFADIKSVLGRAVERISYLFESGDAITGLPTGFTELDEKTSGLQPADLIIVAGRPSMGKTTFAMNLAEHAALSGDQPVAVFSLEMPAEQLAMRMISSIGRVELQKLRTGKLAEQDWPRITSAITLLNQKKNVFIDDTPSLTPTDLRARARRLKREQNGLGLIVIDYLQLMRVAGSAENKATEIAEISRSLKALAKELDVPVIALSQLNRSLEQRPDKRPIMSDLRESGAIEQDADVIMFIYRDEVYNPDLEESKGKAEVLIRKQRNGPIGSLMLTFLGQFTRFENYSPELHHSSGVNESNF